MGHGTRLACPGQSHRTGERDMQDRNLEILSVITIIMLVVAWAALVI